MGCLQKGMMRCAISQRIAELVLFIFPILHVFDTASFVFILLSTLIYFVIEILVATILSFSPTFSPKALIKNFGSRTENT